MSNEVLKSLINGAEDKTPVRVRAGRHVDYAIDPTLETLGSHYRKNAPELKTCRLGVALQPSLAAAFKEFCKQQEISISEGVAIALRRLLKDFGIDA